MQSKVSTLSEVVLDTNKLSISEVKLMPSNVTLSHSKGSTQGDLGEALTIKLPANFETSGEFKLRVFYKAERDSQALHWMGKRETKGGSLPYLFTQCQPIYCRSFAPMQDTIA